MVKTNAEIKNQLWLDIKAKTRTLHSISPKLELYKKLQQEIREMEARLKKIL